MSLNLWISIIAALIIRLMGVQDLRACDSSDGQIRFYAYHLQENKLIHYQKGDEPSQEGMDHIAQLFRSRESDQLHPIDPQLIRLIDQIEDHFQVRQVEIISGYRSDSFNHSLKASGHTVANESFHTKGMAADIHLDEISEEALRDYVVKLKQGGVGYYPSLHMVHIDVGPVRQWAEKTPRKDWVGEKNNEVPVTVTVSPVRSVGNKILEKLTIEGDLSIDSEISIEFFDRGEWVTRGTIRLPKTNQKTVLLSSFQSTFEKLPWGKFRLKANIEGKSDLYQYSNEFYFKRL